MPFKSAMNTALKGHEMHITLRAALASVVALGTCACGGAGIPEFHAADLHGGNFPGIEPRTMSVEIKDERSPKPEEAQKSVDAVKKAIVELLGQRGIGVNDSSPNALQVTLQYPEEVPDGWHREYCITMMSRLKLSQGLFSDSGGYGCFEYKHLLLGISLGGDSSKAYTTALNLMLQQHDKQLSQAFSNQRK